MTELNVSFIYQTISSLANILSFSISHLEREQQQQSKVTIATTYLLDIFDFLSKVCFDVSFKSTLPSGFLRRLDINHQATSRVTKYELNAQLNLAVLHNGRYYIGWTVHYHVGQSLSLLLLVPVWITKSTVPQ